MLCFHGVARVEFVDRAVAVHDNLFRLHAVHFGAKSTARSALGAHVSLTVREGIGSAWACLSLARFLPQTFRVAACIFCMHDAQALHWSLQRSCTYTGITLFSLAAASVHHFCTTSACSSRTCQRVLG